VHIIIIKKCNITCRSSIIKNTKYF